MARIGQNPAKDAPASQLARPITACTIVYVPRQEGFWEGSFEVLRASLTSLRQTTGDDVDLYVLDNGSCAPIRAYLEELRAAGVIDCLLLARGNLGKAGGWNVLLPACPGRYVAYFDSDILFRPGWLEESRAVFEAFEGVGTVTGRPSRTRGHLRESLLSATLASTGAPGVASERGDLIPRAVIDDWARSIGAEGQPTFSGPGDDLRLRRGGVEAFAYSGHYQFLTTPDVVRRSLPIEAGRALGGVRPWDVNVNSLGLLRLATPRALIHHLGNAVAPEERDEVDRVLADGFPERSPHPNAPPAPVRRARRPGALLRTLVKSRRARRVLEKAYLRLHSALH